MVRFMIALIQRVSTATVTIDENSVGEIGAGLLIFLGVFEEDTEKEVDFLANKITGFRIFHDEHGKMNRSILDIGGSALVVSQFTLCGDWRKGRRPSFVRAASPEKGEYLYNEFISQLKSKSIPVESGVFGAMMDVHLINDGPVTFVLDTHQVKF